MGGGGNDSLNGGLGADAFVFTSMTSGVDVIADFNELNGGGEEGDVLRFEGLGVGYFVYLGTGAFTGGSIPSPRSSPRRLRTNRQGRAGLGGMSQKP